MDLQKIRAMIILFHKWQPKERLNTMIAKTCTEAMRHHCWQKARKTIVEWAMDKTLSPYKTVYSVQELTFFNHAHT